MDLNQTELRRIKETEQVANGLSDSDGLKVPRKRKRMTRQADHTLRIPMVWMAIVVQALVLLFFAGVGWNRLAVNERDIQEVKNASTLYASTVTTKLENITVDLAKVSITLKTIVERLPEIAAPIPRQRR